jgi:transglutaminase-like putative cysteine protease
MEEYLKETNFLNFSDKSISSTTKKVISKATTDIEKAVAIHNFVRDEIKFGFTNSFYNMKASDVLYAGVGYCNTKATLFIAMLRCAGIPARQHFVDIDVHILDEVIDPRRDFVDHSFTEVYLNEKWIETDSYIVDKLLHKYATKKLDETKKALGFGFHSQGTTEWDGKSNAMSQYIKDAKGISTVDYGIFQDTEEFFSTPRGEQLNFFTTVLFFVLMPVTNRYLDSYRAEVEKF